MRGGVISSQFLHNRGNKHAITKIWENDNRKSRKVKKYINRPMHEKTTPAQIISPLTRKKLCQMVAKMSAQGKFLDFGRKI